MSKRLLTVAAALTLLLGLNGCSTRAKADRDDLVEKLVEDDGVPREQAECIANALFDDRFKGDDDTLNDIASAEAEDDLPPAVLDVIDEVIEECEAEG